MNINSNMLPNPKLVRGASRLWTEGDESMGYAVSLRDERPRKRNAKPIMNCPR